MGEIHLIEDGTKVGFGHQLLAVPFQIDFRVALYGSPFQDSNGAKKKDVKRISFHVAMSCANENPAAAAAAGTGLAFALGHQSRR